MSFIKYGYALEYRKIEEEDNWTSLLNDEMGLCYKTFEGAADGMRRLKGVFDEKRYVYRIFPLFYSEEPVSIGVTKQERDEESQII